MSQSTSQKAQQGSRRKIATPLPAAREARPEAVKKDRGEAEARTAVNTAPKRRCFQDGGSCFSPPKRRLARNVSSASSVETWTPESRRIMQPHRTLLPRSSNESDVSIDQDAQSPSTTLFNRRGLDAEEATDRSGTLHVYEEGRLLQCSSSDLWMQHR
eukprot:TRINITY_DN2132_c0_g1_i1.p2 TRINITY_DN2132_c0_g1~~TRINITY_DN2132_c0_g1_i1.p2  ORF type:complete len:158 (+),score=28.62 TRINITY_DN2132_c0_g1_i1:58-531(+)